jgi:uncharacterized SAM-binding protein YcdF (DUF218 family)
VPLRPRHSARAQRAAFWRHWTLWIYFPLAVLLVGGWVFALRSGHWLVREDEFARVPWAAVMAGESRGTERADAALKLYLDGRIDSLIYSGIPIFKTRHASEMLVDYLAKAGYPREKLFEFRHDAYSTLEEARLMIRQFRAQDLDTVVIITVNFHTARTRRIFRKLSQGYPHILVYPAEYTFFDPASWWSSREGRKHWLLEWTKTVATWIELMGAAPETGKAESSGLISALAPPPAATLPSRALLESLAAAAGRDSARLADSLAAMPKDSADTAQALRADSAKTAAPDTLDKPEQASLAAREPAPRKESSKGAAKDTALPKSPAKAPAKTSAKKPSEKEREKEKEKAKKKPSR